MYGRTVLMTTLAASAIARNESALLTSASSSSRVSHAGLTPASLERTSSSLPRLRPASAQRVSAGACSARYSAVSAPVNPVAPNRTTSNRGSAIVTDVPGGVQRLGRRHSRLGGDPASHRRRHPLGRVGRLPSQVEQIFELVLVRRRDTEPLRVGVYPLSCVHGRE